MTEFITHEEAITLFPILRQRGWSASDFQRMVDSNLLDADENGKFSRDGLRILVEMRYGNPRGCHTERNRKARTTLKGPLFLSINDLMQLMGTPHYKSAQRRHQTIRDALAPGKTALTIKEYCDYEQIDFQEVYFELRGCYPAGMLESSEK